MAFFVSWRRCANIGFPARRGSIKHEDPASNLNCFELGSLAQPLVPVSPRSSSGGAINSWLTFDHKTFHTPNRIFEFLDVYPWKLKINLASSVGND